MSDYDQIRLIACGLSPGQTASGETCPFCYGGRTREKSFNVSKLQSGVSVYVCHRAQCRRKGRIDGGVGLHDRPAVKPQEFTPRLFTGILEDVPDNITRLLHDKYGITKTELEYGGIGWSPDYSRTAWPVLAPSGAVRGYELRRHDSEGGQKTLHYRHSPDPWCGHIPCEGVVPSKRVQVGPCVVVEDLVSALKVSRQFYAVSLMGSHLDFDVLRDIMNVTENLHLALDRDATAKAEELIKKHKFICPTIKLVPLQRDMKYMSDDDISRCIST